MYATHAEYAAAITDHDPGAQFEYAGPMNPGTPLECAPTPDPWSSVFDRDAQSDIGATSDASARSAHSVTAKRPKHHTRKPSVTTQPVPTGQTPVLATNTAVDILRTINTKVETMLHRVRTRSGATPELNDDVTADTLYSKLDELAALLQRRTDDERLHAFASPVAWEEVKQCYGVTWRVPVLTATECGLDLNVDPTQAADGVLEILRKAYKGQEVAGCGIVDQEHIAYKIYVEIASHHPTKRLMPLYFRHGTRYYALQGAMLPCPAVAQTVRLVLTRAAELSQRAIRHKWYTATLLSEVAASKRAAPMLVLAVVATLRPPPRGKAAADDAVARSNDVMIQLAHEITAITRRLYYD